jgi:hypothetical protein
MGLPVGRQETSISMSSLARQGHVAEELALYQSGRQA